MRSRPTDRCASAPAAVREAKLPPALSGFFRTARADDEMRNFLMGALEYLGSFAEGNLEVPVAIIRAMNDVERLAQIEESALPAGEAGCAAALFVADCEVGGGEWISPLWKHPSRRMVENYLGGRMHTRRLLVVIALLLVNACSTLEMGIETTPHTNGPWQASPLVTPTTLSAMSATSSVSPLPPATLVNTISGCPTNPEQAGVIAQAHLVVESSRRSGWCEVSLPLNGYKTVGYSLRYPAGWIITLAGAEGMNLHFDAKTSSGKNPRVFVQLAATDLPLKQADKATYGFEMSGPGPLVGADENQISRALQVIGDKQVLVLATSKGDLSIKRYFTLHGGTLYMFEIETPAADIDTSEHAKLATQVEEMISSLQFMP